MMFKKLIKEERDKLFNKTVDEERTKYGKMFDEMNFTEEKLRNRYDAEPVYHKPVIPNTDINYSNELIDIAEQQVENAKIILLDKDRKIIGSKIIASGNWQSVDFDYRALTKYLLSNEKVRFYILAHNHPTGYGQSFSQNDYAFTFRIARFTEQLSIIMLDSVVCSKYDFVSMIQSEDKYRGIKVIGFRWNDGLMYRMIQMMPRPVYSFMFQFEMLRDKALGIESKYDIKWSDDTYERWEELTNACMVYDESGREKYMNYFREKIERKNRSNQ